MTINDAITAVLLGLAVGVLILWRALRATNRTQPDTAWKRAIYNPKEFRRPSGPRRR